MARSYKALSQKANMIKTRLEEKGLSNVESLEILNNNLEIFWNKYNQKSPTNSGISFNKNMTSQQKKEMAEILRTFIDSPRKTENEISEEYESKFTKYLQGLSPKYREKIEKENDNKTVKEMYEELTKIERILNERKVIESLGSDLLHDIYYSKIPDLNLSEEKMTLALFNVVQSDYRLKDEKGKFLKDEENKTIPIDGLSQDDLWNVILNEYNLL